MIQSSILLIFRFRKGRDLKIERMEVEHVAALARLRLSEEEIDKFTGQLDGILTYFEMLSSLDTSDVESTAHVIEITNAFRDDEARASYPPDKILENAPECENQYFRVPRIVDSGE